MKKVYFTFFVATIYANLFAQNFNQNFADGGVYADYVSTASNATENNKFAGITAITAASITNNKLRFERANSVTLLSSWTIGSTTSPFSPTPTVAKVSMEYTISNNQTFANQRQYLAIGEAFSINQSPPVNGNIHSSLSIRTTANAGEFYVNNGSVDSQAKGSEVGPYSGTVVFTWVINNLGAPYTYTAPNGSSAEVANDTWDLYIGNTLILDDQEAINGSKNMNAVKYAFGNTNAGSNVSGKITVDMDDISVNTLSTLPVSLTSFTGTNFGENIRLNWNTSSEQNNSHFNILRSEDGKIFNNIGTIKGNGTSQQEHHYSYNDISPMSGINYYQLIQVDLDGTRTFDSRILAIKSSITPGEFRIAITENTFTSIIYASKNTSGDLSVSDMMGRKIYNKKVRLDKGLNTVILSDIHLAEGIFVGNLLMDGKQYAIKFSK